VAAQHIAFWDARHVVAVEDAGDNAAHAARRDGLGLDARRERRLCVTVDSAGAHARAGPRCISDHRLEPVGRPRLPEGDNEITGIHVSDGDATEGGLLGAKIPRPFKDGWRVFYRQQHGDNVTYEILPARSKGGGWDDDRD
jgi:hypothetical protein